MSLYIQGEEFVERGVDPLGRERLEGEAAVPLARVADEHVERTARPCLQPPLRLMSDGARVLSERRPA